jgi:hypothetical protein
MSTKFIATLKSVGDSDHDISLVSRSVEIAKEENDGRARFNENETSSSSKMNRSFLKHQ